MDAATADFIASLCPGCFAVADGANPCPHCGYDARCERGFALPHHTRLNHEQFVVGRVLGTGGFGITYLCWDLGLATRVALKEFLPIDYAWRGNNQVTVTAKSQRHHEFYAYGLQRFLGEARTLAQLDHPNIVRVKNYFEANGTAYLVMDYYAGLALAEHLESQGGRLPEAQAKDLLLPILDGLRAVHAKGYLHRDIKPDNIYLARLPSGGVRPILLDFGAARQAMGERSGSLSAVLTPGYAPFEQYHRKGQQGPWTDVYAAAATLYRMVTGEPPPEANERMAGDDLRPATDFGISRALSDALGQGLAMAPAARPQTVQTFQALLSLLDPDPDHDSKPKPKPKPQTWWPAAFAVTLLLLGLGAGYLYHALQNPPASTPDTNQAALHRAADDRAYGIAAQVDTPDAYQSYLDTCAADGCGHRAAAAAQMATAQQRLDRAAEQARTAEAARQAEATRQADLADYAAAERLGTADAYRAYLANCTPKGCNKRAAAQANRDRLAQRDLKLPTLVRIDAGCFQMGSPAKEAERESDERQHQVCVDAFELGQTEVTFEEYDRFARATGRALPEDRGWGRGRRPVIHVDWQDATAYAEWLSAQTGGAYRLPTEAEWEYAARAGTTGPFWTGPCLQTDQANYDGTKDYGNCGSRTKTGVYRQQTLPVGSLKPNPWGLYDVAGNVWEWTCSGYDEPYGGGEKTCTSKNDAKTARVLRGGAWGNDPRDLRSADRDWGVTGNRYYSLGFRVARTLSP